MRTIIDLPDDQITALARQSAKYNTSRAAMVRDAVAEYLVNRRDPIDDQAFGLFRENPLDVPGDGLAWQNSLRDEWRV